MTGISLRPASLFLWLPAPAVASPAFAGRTAGDRSIAGASTYDANNKMTAFTGPSGSMTEQGTYVYDGQGNRVKRTSTIGSNTTTTTYVYDAFGKLAAE
ncbi:MAG: RHS repeat protein [Bryobacterales bacterium]|nr:RHS repeat protein [Bryobacterales bacterium]